jgi:hypothetical protein
MACDQNSSGQCSGDESPPHRIVYNRYLLLTYNGYGYIQHTRVRVCVYIYNQTAIFCKHMFHFRHLLTGIDAISLSLTSGQTKLECLSPQQVFPDY